MTNNSGLKIFDVLPFLYPIYRKYLGPKMPIRDQIKEQKLVKETIKLDGDSGRKYQPFSANLDYQAGKKLGDGSQKEGQEPIIDLSLIHI